MTTKKLEGEFPGEAFVEQVKRQRANEMFAAQPSASAPGAPVEPPLVRTAVGDVHPGDLAASRPVEQSGDIRCYCSDFNSAGMPCQPGTCPNRPPPRSVERCSCEVLAKLREAGWSVAVHNDYRIGGVAHTFWLFTHADGRWAKGEGTTDFEALRDIARRSLALGEEEQA